MKPWILLATFGMMLSGLVCYVAAEPVPESNAAQLSANRAKIANILQRLNHSRRQHNAVTQQVEQLETELARHQTQLEAISTQIQYQSEQISKTRFERERLLRRQAIEKKQLIQQVRAAYMTGRRERARLLLSQNSGSKMGRILAYYDYLNRLRLKRVSRVESTQARLLVLEKQYQANLLTQKKLSETQAQKVKVIAEKREVRHAVLMRIDQQLSKNNTQLAALRDSEAHLLRFVKTVQSEMSTTTMARAPQNIDPENTQTPEAALSENEATPEEPVPVQSMMSRDATPFVKLRGQLALPTRGTVAAKFRTAKLGGEARWMGILIAAPEGTPVQVVAPGQVIFADFEGVYGNMVVIEHGDGYATIYAHLMQTQATVGAQVEAGEKIGTVGNTGGQSEVGLEFLLTKDGDWINPEPWFGQAN